MRKIIALLFVLFSTNIFAQNTFKFPVIFQNTVKITSGSLVNGYVLTSDASGNATWQPASTGSLGWLTTGNSGTVAATNFVGTTDNVGLSFRTNNVKSGLIDPTGAIFFGYQAGNVNTAITSTGIGYRALLLNTSGANNVAVGTSSLQANVTGVNNTAIGSNALLLNTGNSNTAVGGFALDANTSGAQNVGVGVGALGFFHAILLPSSPRIAPSMIRAVFCPLPQSLNQTSPLLRIPSFSILPTHHSCRFRATIEQKIQLPSHLALGRFYRHRISSGCQSPICNMARQI